MRAPLEETVGIGQRATDVFVVIKDVVEFGADHLVGKIVLLVHLGGGDTARGVTPESSRLLAAQEGNRLLEERVVMGLEQGREGILGLEGCELQFAVKRQ